MSVTRWVLITGEYPPAPGGVSDYSSMVARGLAEAGDEVHVWAPAYEFRDFQGGMLSRPIPLETSSQGLARPRRHGTRHDARFFL